MKKLNSFFLILFTLSTNVSQLTATILLPKIPATKFVITSYGATTESQDNSTAINDAISAANKAGGGTVIIPKGHFFSGPITMKSNVNLFLSEGSILEMMPYGEGNGLPAGSYPPNGKPDSYSNFISGTELSNIAVTGTGTIEGNGFAWWDAFKAKKNISKMVRPYLIRFKGCHTVLVEGITLQNAPNVHLAFGQNGAIGSNGTISHVTIKAPATSPNTDAVDTWSWNGVNITHCNFAVGDDNVAIDSYSHDISITNCAFGTGHGVSVGSFTADVQNVRVDSCSFTSATNGLRLKSCRGRGGADSTFVYSNISMENVKWPFYITGWYPKEPYPADQQTDVEVDKSTPAFSNILFKNITVKNSPNAGIIYGLPEMFVKNVVFDNVSIQSTKKGFIANYIKGLVFKNGSSITVPEVDAISAYNAEISGIDLITGKPVTQKK